MRNFILFVFFLLPLSLFSQQSDAEIEIIHFNSNVSYASNSSISIHINPKGLYDINNEFSLEIEPGFNILIFSRSKVDHFI